MVEPKFTVHVMGLEHEKSKCSESNKKTFYSEKFGLQISDFRCHYIFHIFRYEDAVELLLKHGARVDVEARMCWPGPHQHNCEERSKNVRKGLDIVYPSSDKLQCAIYYAIDGDQVRMIMGQSYPPC